MILAHRFIMKPVFHFILIVALCWVGYSGFSQTKQKYIDTIQDQPVKQIVIFGNDTVVNSAIELDEVMILPQLDFKNKKDYRKYLILQRKTRKVWPYATLASKRLDSLSNRLKTIKSKRKKRRYTKIIQSYIEDEFKAELKKLTHTEGQILVKLMHRQTGITTYELIKELRTGWNAFWWQTTAKLFEISLKEEYQPKKNEIDFIIEDILQRAFRHDVLEQQDPAIDIKFADLVDHWGNRVQFYE